MELVYLWVEDYKNIQNQGFNFSSRFDCHYDGEELMIKENPEHIPDFFGKNINVTAVVGKNGSGKSRILELISLFRFEKLQEYIKEKKLIMIFRSKDKLYIPSTYNTTYGGNSFKSFDMDSIVNKSSYETDIKDTIQHDSLFWLTLFTNGLSDFTEGQNILRGNHFQSFYNGSDNHGENEEYKFYKKFSVLLKDNTNIFKILNEDFVFDSMYIELDLTNLSSNIYDDIEELKEIEYFFQKNIDDNYILLGEKRIEITKETLIYSFLTSYFFFKVVDIIKDPPSIWDRKKISEIFLEKLLFIKINEIIEICNRTKDNDEFYILMGIMLDTIKEIYSKYKSILYEACKDKSGELEHFNMNTKELECINNYEGIIQYMVDSFELDSNSLKLKNKIHGINQADITSFYDFFSSNDFYTELHLSGRLYFNFIHSQKNHITFNSLSTGEKQLLKFITNLTYTLIDTKYENRMVLLDEIETAFHPQWQKKFVNIIIRFIEEIREKKLIPKENEYHLIFVTHSPFILSDMPRENIIFLDKYSKDDIEVKNKEQLDGNCKKINGLKEREQTFGANIHTLLSDSFFMEDGLMGEFAKGKINEIKEFYEKVIKEKNIDENIEFYGKYQKKFWQIQKIIGEPFLQKIVKNQLEEIELVLLGKDEAIDKEIARLQALKENSTNA
ncbi:MAG: Unknown protein [uncultured Sulfurovum sp.]|uniref:ATPase AAA-type core domain-containing protein n=1 Tax=uncultured Sulfurovum sp. TaxID=269237 RepID=A0A6S6TLJ2_9BACT|nr:MAG: Unknown protein [uncultured Sulfurovum sp.]